jgi:hypothetical protein
MNWEEAFTTGFESEELSDEKEMNEIKHSHRMHKVYNIPIIDS